MQDLISIISNVPFPLDPLRPDMKHLEDYKLADYLDVSLSFKILLKYAILFPCIPIR